MNYTFNRINELYERILPALEVKESIMHDFSIINITSKDIFNTLRISYWNKRKDIMLNEIVHDILNIDNYKLYELWKGLLNEENRSKCSK